MKKLTIKYSELYKGDSYQLDSNFDSKECANSIIKESNISQNKWYHIDDSQEIYHISNVDIKEKVIKLNESCAPYTETVSYTINIIIDKISKHGIIVPVDKKIILKKSKKFSIENTNETIILETTIKIIDDLYSKIDDLNKKIDHLTKKSHELSYADLESTRAISRINDRLKKGIPLGGPSPFYL